LRESTHPVIVCGGKRKPHLNDEALMYNPLQGRGLPSTGFKALSFGEGLGEVHKKRHPLSGCLYA